jgi:pimeloyl-ACP methyl ester carboxylesterase
MRSSEMTEGCRSQFITSDDGLRVHVNVFGSRRQASVPVVCLPGLARTGADFDALAMALSHDLEPPRCVITMDYRGRGRSDYDRNPLNYNLATELADLLSVITALDIGPAVFIGTSRGGILAMLLATARPTAIAGVVLNDIGPVIEVRGLARIKSYVGQLPEPSNFADGARILRQVFAAHFPKLSDDDWMAFAKRSFKEQEGRLVPTYDVRIAKALESIDLERPIQPLWSEFDALSSRPVMVIRGANSDILSAATVEAMRARRRNMVAIEVPDQGHAPLLAEREIIGQISSFLSGCERIEADSENSMLGSAAESAAG